LPKISQIDAPVYSSDTAIQEALVANQIQWAGDFIPGVNKIYVGPSPYHHFWGSPIYTVVLYPNLLTWPTNQLAVRQAISLAINRTELATVAEDGQVPPLLAATGLVPALQSFTIPALANAKLGYNISAAKSTLEKAGFVMGSNGFFQTKSGKALTLEITDPSAFSDWVTADSLMVQSLRSAGIDASFVGQSVSGYRSDLGDGDYQIGMWFGTLTLGTTPYSLYNDEMNSALTAPIGKVATGNFERLYSSAIDKDLAALASAGTLPKEMAALAPLEEYAAMDLPVIPTFPEPSFDEYNTQNFTGWPTASDPYADGTPTSVNNEMVLLRLVPRS
jgi:peptide/nickel transport system substrate-binding protein